MHDIALDTLTLGRAHLVLGLQSLASGASSASASAAAGTLAEAVEGLRASGQNDHLAGGLLARAAFAEPWAIGRALRALLPTVHPAYLLRLPDPAAKAAETRAFASDLKPAAVLAQRLQLDEGRSAQLARYVS